MSKQQNQFSYKGYLGSAEISHEDGCLVGQILHIDDLIMYQGETYAALKKEFEGAVEEYLALCKRLGKEAQKTYSGNLNIRIGQELHDKVARAAQKQGLTLNDYIKQALAGSVATEIQILTRNDPWILPATNPSPNYSIQYPIVLDNSFVATSQTLVSADYTMQGQSTASSAVADEIQSPQKSKSSPKLRIVENNTMPKAA